MREYIAEDAVVLRIGTVRLSAKDLINRVDIGQVEAIDVETGLAKIVKPIQLKAGTAFGWDQPVKGLPVNLAPARRARKAAEPVDSSE